jgi:hypothetical protein
VGVGDEGGRAASTPTGRTSCGARTSPSTAPARAGSTPRSAGPARGAPKPISLGGMGKPVMTVSEVDWIVCDPCRADRTARPEHCLNSGIGGVQVTGQVVRVNRCEAVVEQSSADSANPRHQRRRRSRHRPAVSRSQDALKLVSRDGPAALIDRVEHQHGVGQDERSSCAPRCRRTLRFCRTELLRGELRLRWTLPRLAVSR